MLFTERYDVFGRRTIDILRTLILEQISFEPLQCYSTNLILITIPRIEVLVVNL